jgi:hypothetical protein
MVHHSSEELLEGNRVVHAARAGGCIAQLSQIGTGAEVRSLAREKDDAGLWVDGSVPEGPR